jgi:hypothetical protein
MNSETARNLSSLHFPLRGSVVWAVEATVAITITGG